METYRRMIYLLVSYSFPCFLFMTVISESKVNIIFGTIFTFLSFGFSAGYAFFGDSK